MTHPRTTLALTLGLCAAGAAAWSLGGGSLGTGVLLGFLLGTALCGFSLAWQTHWLRVAPRRALNAQVEGFLVKLAALLVCALVFRYVDSLAQRVDWRAFVVAYAAAVALLLPISTFETVHRPRPSKSVPQRTAL